ncbi:hypothetical protein [Candidatus Marithrix sp. Canyon 246]|uniref:hypothetical protein n=1 Tax=Candidatus Marithrix sp. Canyon 246 TaxID=1827136 RepID=UPI00084A222E|nr:hypothetical protein [Candidatus Marithrix sp. Canyon 246]
MLNNDDKIWLDTIAGKNVPEDANPDTVAEAQALRDAFHAEEQLQKLMSRIAAETKTEPKETFIEKLRLWWASNTMTPVLVPLVVVVSFVGLIVVKMIPNPKNNDLMLPKSAPKIQPLNSTEAIVKISPTAKQTAEQLKQEFIAAGADVKLTNKQKSYQLDIEMPTSASDKLRDLCDRIGIDAENRSVRIIVKLPE